MYAPAKSITVENCTVKNMRGGIRLYLGKNATVKNCTVTHCESVAYNLPSDAVLTKCSGDFTYGPLTDYRLSRSRTKAEWTILPSPDATGDHNIMNIEGAKHHITLLRPKGKLNLNEKRTILVNAKSSKIINKTEYSITLTEQARDNEIESYGPVLGNTNNSTVKRIKELE